MRRSRFTPEQQLLMDATPEGLARLRKAYSNMRWSTWILLPAFFVVFGALIWADIVTGNQLTFIPSTWILGFVILGTLLNWQLLRLRVAAAGLIRELQAQVPPAPAPGIIFTRPE